MKRVAALFGGGADKAMKRQLREQQALMEREKQRKAVADESLRSTRAGSAGSFAYVEQGMKSLLGN